MKTFSDRLTACLQQGNLTVADLARWFDRANATVRSWVRDGHEPRGGPLDAAMTRGQLVMLEKKIAARDGFPVPLLSPKERIKHLARLRPRLRKSKRPVGHKT